MVCAVRISYTPGSLLSISTVRPVYSLPSEIWPLAPTRLIDAIIISAIHAVMRVGSGFASAAQFGRVATSVRP